MKAAAISIRMRPLARMFDVAAGTALVAAAAPLLLGAAAAVWLEDRGPVLYRQRRVGLGGREFDLLKLRSMRVNKIPPTELGQVRAEHPMVTRVGRWLRRLKIDELPQLINVVAGDMSLVGPRPTVPEQVANYTVTQRRRLEVRPGLTGWAQINGNTELSWDERILLDIFYIDHATVLLDAEILFRTAAVVLFGEARNNTALGEARDHADRLNRRS